MIAAVFGQPRPDIGEHDDHQRRQVEQHHEPGIARAGRKPARGPWRARCALPSAIAIAKRRATRASVTPRLKASAPDRASSTIASETACGSGSRRAPTMCEPANHAASSSATETSRSSQVHSFGPGAVERAGIELLRRADEFRRRRSRRARDRAPRVGRFVGQRPAWNSLRDIADDRSRARRRSSSRSRGASRCHSAGESARISFGLALAAKKRSSSARLLRAQPPSNT